MLVKLYVQNYALIKDLDVEPGDGLTIVTGETGAGKSILLGALSLILGNRADTSVLLDKTKKCIVEGTFRIDNYDLAGFFNANELDYEPVSIIRREINPAGKSRAFINDTPVNINILKELGEMLIDIHSQHQTLMLHDYSFQLNVIDSFIDAPDLIEKYKATFRTFRDLRKKYNEARAGSEKNQADLEYNRYQLEQLEEAGLAEGEQEELEKEQELLTHAEEIKLALTTISELFYADSASVLVNLREVKNQLSKIRSFFPGGEGLTERAESSYIELDDLAGEIQKLSDSIDADPQRLIQVNERLDIIYSLIQKHRVKDLPELIAKREELKNLIRSIETDDELVAELQSALEKETAGLRILSEKLSDKRKNILPDVETKITGLLKQLGMPNARFRIILSPKPDFTPAGTDEAEFLFSANKQVEPENLARIASGGELSRVMLSLKSLLTWNTSLPTIIFDEIDAGVSGEVADKVGQILAGMGQYMQVINITHLPQVASRGTRHYHVYKDETGDATITRVKLLSPDERVIEVARLLSGSEITETAILNARELIRSAGID